MATIKSSFLIVGGGIAGVSCSEVISFYCPNESIVLLTESSVIKTVTNLVPLAKSLVRFDVQEMESRKIENKNVNVIVEQLQSINSKESYVITDKGTTISYRFLCLCTGARPKIIENGEVPEIQKYILGIRDTESASEFQKKIKTSRKLVIVGNGGIASEVVYEIRGIEIDWVIKDDYITSTFLDPGAAQFLQKKLKSETIDIPKTTIKRMRYYDVGEHSKKGAALGPDWHRSFDMTGALENQQNSVNIHYNDEIHLVKLNEVGTEYPISVQLKNKKEIIDCDFIVSATGVVPDLNFMIDAEFKLGPDGGIFVDDQMKTSIDNIFAAGDICYAGWDLAENWFQMRLWTQARQMGMMAGKGMAAVFTNEPIYQDFCFELFGHVTKLYGYDVVLLGRYNGQGLDNKYEILLRITPDKEYIKFILFEGKLRGAILIGDTGLEETCENLILNQLDLTPFGEDILNPEIDIEDFFD